MPIISITGSNKIEKPPPEIAEINKILNSKNEKTTETQESQELKTGKTWPESLRKAAFHSLAGDIVRTVEPHTEADPAALLFSLLVMTGNAIGRTPYFVAEADRHYLNFFSCLVGTTAKGRKGVSFGQIKNFFYRDIMV